MPEVGGKHFAYNKAGMAAAKKAAKKKKVPMKMAKPPVKMPMKGKS